AQIPQFHGDRREEEIEGDRPGDGRMKPLGVGFALHPEAAYLELCRDIIEQEVDFLEVTPEALWQADREGGLSGNPWTSVLACIQERSGKPFVAHGLGLSPGTAGDRDEIRLQHWLQQIALQQQRFGFLWYTEHLGWIQTDGLEAVLPLPLPPTE